MAPTFPPRQRPFLLLSSPPWNTALAGDRLSRRPDRPVESIPAHARGRPGRKC
jgi:hypothetical protein